MRELQALILMGSTGFALAFCRAAGFVAASPFPGGQVSVSARVGLAVVLALIVAATTPFGSLPAELGPRTVALALSEAACGLTLGIVFRGVFSAAEVLGHVLSQSTGLSSPTTFNPALEMADPPLGRAAALLGMLLALGAGAHRIALAHLLESFRALPVGRTVNLAAVTPEILDLSIDAVNAGLRLAMPVVAVGLVVQLALALIARAAPSLQVFNIGIGITLASGFAVMMASLGDISSGILAHFETLPARMGRALLQLAGASP